MEDCWWAPGFLPPGRAALLPALRPRGALRDPRRPGRRALGQRGRLLQLVRSPDARRPGARDPVPPELVRVRPVRLDRYGFAGRGPGVDPTPGSRPACCTAPTPSRSSPSSSATPALDARRSSGGTPWPRRASTSDFGRGAEGSYERQLLWVFQRYPGIARAHEWPNPSLAPMDQARSTPPRSCCPTWAPRAGWSATRTRGCSARTAAPSPASTPAATRWRRCSATPTPVPGACITPAMAFGRLAADDMAAPAMSRVVLVTGGTRGLGRGSRRPSPQTGDQVVVCGRNRRRRARPVRGVRRTRRRQPSTRSSLTSSPRRAASTWSSTTPAGRRTRWSPRPPRASPSGSWRSTCSRRSTSPGPRARS